jgi:hypothetical protein
MTLELTATDRSYYSESQKKARQLFYNTVNKITENGNNAANQLDALKRIANWTAKHSNGCYDRAEVETRSIIGDMMIKLERNIRNYGANAYGLSDKQLAYACDDTAKLVA